MSDDLEARIATLALRLDRESATRRRRVSPARAPSPRRWRPALMLAGALVLLLAAGVVVWIARPGASPEVRSTPPATAAAPSDSAPPATSAPPAPAVTPTSATCAAGGRPLVPGEYAYWRLETLALGNLTGGQSYNVRTPEVVEYWVAADGSGRIRQTFGTPEFVSQADHDLWVARGSPRGSITDADGRFPADPNRVRDTCSIPADADELFARLRDGTLPGYGSEPGDRAAFDRIAMIMGNSYVSPELSRAFYAVVQRLDGVQPLGEVQDHAGRTGIAYGYDAPSPNIRHELVFDPDSGVLLEDRTIGTDPALDTNVPAAEGDVFSRFTFLSTGIVTSINEIIP